MPGSMRVASSVESGCLDPASRSRCGCESLVRSNQDCAKCFGKGDVASIVGSEVPSEVPHSLKKRCRWEDRNREIEQVLDGSIRLFRRQLTPVDVAPNDRGDLDSQEVRASDRLTVEALPESPSVFARIGHHRGEN